MHVLSAVGIAFFIVGTVVSVIHTPQMMIPKNCTSLHLDFKRIPVLQTCSASRVAEKGIVPTRVKY